MGFRDADVLTPRSPAQDAERAIELVNSLRDMLIAAANSMGGGDAARYYEAHGELEDILRRLGVRMPFPWPVLHEGVEAAKTEHSGNGSYDLRRRFFKSMAEPALVTLRRRVADNESGNLAATIAGLRTTAAESLSDIRSIRAELARIEAALPEDPSVAIGKANNLVEATAKVILADLGHTVDEKADVRAVAVDAARALGLVPTGPPADREAAKINSQVRGIVDAVATFRNHAGDSHGAAAPPESLDSRHGRLAVRAAITWCTFMIDSFADQAGHLRN